MDDQADYYVGVTYMLFVHRKFPGFFFWNDEQQKYFSRIKKKKREIKIGLISRYLILIFNYNQPTDRQMAIGKYYWKKHKHKNDNDNKKL